MVETHPLLQVSNLSKCFGGIRAIHNLSFSIPENCIYGIIGPNGAGKTTLFNVITGLYSCDYGDIRFRQHSLTCHSIDQIVKLGIARTFQNIRLFGNMSVLENVMVGAHTHSVTGLIGAVLRGPRVRREETRIQEASKNLLGYVGLLNQENKIAGTLSYGDQRRLEIARALATQPTLIALDEPAAGMNPSETLQLRQLIEKLHQDRIGVLIIEHDMKLMMNLCHRILVLDHGEIISEGSPTQVREDPRVIEAYLGIAQS